MTHDPRSTSKKTKGTESQSLIKNNTEGWSAQIRKIKTKKVMQIFKIKRNTVESDGQFT